MLYMVYRKDLTFHYDEEGFTDTLSCYYTVRFDDLTVSGGTVSVDLMNYTETSASFDYSVQYGEETYETDGYYVNGYETLDDAFNECVCCEYGYIQLPVKYRRSFRIRIEVRCNLGRQRIGGQYRCAALFLSDFTGGVRDVGLSCRRHRRFYRFCVQISGRENTNQKSAGFPINTFLINIAGAFVIGCLAAAAAKKQ